MSAILAVGLAACGSDNEGLTVDLAVLDVGNYPTQPREPRAVESMEEARIVEAQRLGNFVPAPSDIDPAFVEPAIHVPTVFIDPKVSLGQVMSVDRFAEAAPDFISGFISIAANAPMDTEQLLFNAVMIFPDEQRAAAAAAALERVDFEADSANQAIAVPKYPAAHAHWKPDRQLIGSWFATGNLVIFTLIYDYLKIFLKKVDPAALIALAEKSLDTIVPSVAKFSPTPRDKLMSASVDDEGVLGRTIPRPREELRANPPGVYHGHAALHFTSDPVGVRKMIEENGVDKFADNGTLLYRARDAAAAERASAVLGGLSKRFRSAEAPQNLPMARCKEYIGRKPSVIRFYCSVSYSRYAAYTSSRQLLDAQQRISAQYAILVNAE